MGGSLAVDLAKLDLEREASERNKGFVVRNRLKRVSNEAVRCSAFLRKEELRRYSDRYIEFVKSPDGHMLTSPAFGRSRQLVVRVWSRKVKSVMR